MITRWVLKLFRSALAAYVLAVTELHPQVRQVHRRAENSFTNDHCAGNKDKVWSYRPESKCAIDVQVSASIIRNHKTLSLKALSMFPLRLSESAATCRNHGHGLPLIRDARGSLRVQAEVGRRMPASAPLGRAGAAKWRNKLG